MGTCWCNVSYFLSSLHGGSTHSNVFRCFWSFCRNGWTHCSGLSYNVWRCDTGLRCPFTSFRPAIGDIWFLVFFILLIGLKRLDAVVSKLILIRFVNVADVGRVVPDYLSFIVDLY